MLTKSAHGNTIHESQVMEYMEGGDLRRALWKNEGNEFAWERRGQQVALDIARGLHFLHSSGVIHRCESRWFQVCCVFAVRRLKVPDVPCGLKYLCCSGITGEFDNRKQHGGEEEGRQGGNNCANLHVCSSSRQGPALHLPPNLQRNACACTVSLRSLAHTGGVLLQGY